MQNESKKHPAAGLIFCCLLLGCLSGLWADNPLVTHIYTADPAPLVYNGRFYIFCGHDEGLESGGWILREWRVLSSADMVNWTDHGAVLRVSDISWLNTDQAWASQCVYRNGRFYFYICDSGEIGVVTSTNILGPYTDALGRPLISNQTPGACPGDDNIDPTCFIDDDGQAYLYWGTDRVARQARLNDDMISIQGEIMVPQGIDRFFEASWVHKRNGIYYYSYAAYNSSGDNWPSNIDYATSNNPLGPWTYRGTLNGAAGVGTNHPGIAEYMGQWYFVYHTDYLSGGIAWQRSVSIEYLYYNSDGTMQRIIQTDEGVGPVNPEPTTPPAPTDPPTPLPPGTQILEAEAAYWNNGVVETEHSGFSGSGYVNTANEVGAYIEWSVNLSSAGSAQCAFRYANGAESRPMQLSVNGSTVVSSLDFPGTGDWTAWQNVNVNINLNAGNNTIRLTSLLAEGAANLDRLDITTGSSGADCGDVNGSGSVDIVDALMTAQYYVGLNPSGFDAAYGDVNGDGSITIVDALMIAQYYVGLLGSLDC